MVKQERKYMDIEGELSRRLTFISAAALGVQDASGLAGDAMNIWHSPPYVLEVYPIGDISKVELLKRLNEPIETYEKYYRNGGHTPEECDELMDVVNPESIARFDAQVNEYNALPIKHKQDGVWRKYYDRCKGIIMMG